MNIKNLWLLGFFVLILAFGMFVGKVSAIITNIETTDADGQFNGNEYGIHGAQILLEGDIGGYSHVNIGNLTITQGATTITVIQGSVETGGNALTGIMATKINIGGEVTTNSAGEYAVTFILPFNAPLGLVTFGFNGGIETVPIAPNFVVQAAPPPFTTSPDSENWDINANYDDQDVFKNGATISYDITIEWAGDGVSFLTILGDFRQIDNSFGTTDGKPGGPAIANMPPVNTAPANWDQLIALETAVKKAISSGKLVIEDRDDGDYSVSYTIPLNNTASPGVKNIALYAIDYPSRFTVSQIKNIYKNVSAWIGLTDLMLFTHLNIRTWLTGVDYTIPPNGDFEDDYEAYPINLNNFGIRGSEVTLAGNIGDKIQTDLGKLVVQKQDGSWITITAGSIMDGYNGLMGLDGTTITSNRIITNSDGRYHVTFNLPLNIMTGNFDGVLNPPGGIDAFESTIRFQTVAEGGTLKGQAESSITYIVQIPNFNRVSIFPTSAIRNGDTIQIDLNMWAAGKGIMDITLLPDFSNVDSAFHPPANVSDDGQTYNINNALSVKSLINDVQKAILDGRMNIDSNNGYYYIEYRISPDGTNVTDLGPKTVTVYAIDFPSFLDMKNMENVITNAGLVFPDALNIVSWYTPLLNTEPVNLSNRGRNFDFAMLNPFSNPPKATWTDTNGNGMLDGNEWTTVNYIYKSGGKVSFMVQVNPHDLSKDELRMVDIEDISDTSVGQSLYGVKLICDVSALLDPNKVDLSQDTNGNGIPDAGEFVGVYAGRSGDDDDLDGSEDDEDSTLNGFNEVFLFTFNFPITTFFKIDSDNLPIRFLMTDSAGNEAYHSTWSEVYDVKNKQWNDVALANWTRNSEAFNPASYNGRNPVYVDQHCRGNSTGLTATTLTDSNAEFWPNIPGILAGAELNPNISQEQAYTIIDNIGNAITVQNAIPPITTVAQVGNPYRIEGETFFQDKGSRAYPPNPAQVDVTSNGYKIIYNWDKPWRIAIEAGKPEIEKISPIKCYNSGTIALIINGFGLNPNSQVNLTKTGEADIIATNVTSLSNGTGLNATFDLTDKTPGIWSLTIIGPDNLNLTLPDSLTILDGKQIQIAVTDPDYDDIGAVLNSMGYEYIEIQDEDLANYEYIKQFNVIFINCSKDCEEFAPEAKDSIELFVKEGGCVYASDWAFIYVDTSFPGHITFPPDPYIGEYDLYVQANVTDAGLTDYLGKSNMQIYYNLGGWVPIQGIAPDVNVYLRGTTETKSYLATTESVGLGRPKPPVSRNLSFMAQSNQVASTISDMPICVSFNYGKGKVLYTTFHNEAQVSEDERKLLEYLILIPYTGNLSTDLANAMMNLGYGVEKENLGTIDKGGTSNPHAFSNSNVQNLAFGVNWSGSILKLSVYKPDGTLYNEIQGDPPLIISVSNAEAGEWHYTITGVDVPIDNYPYVAQIGTPGTLELILLKSGWNMISFPGTPVNPDPSSLVTGDSKIILPLYKWNPGTFNYEKVTQLKLGEGYWILTMADETLKANVNSASSYTVDLKAGWNMIGSVSTQVDFSDPQDTPDKSIIPPLYSYNPTTFGYKDKNSIDPCFGYWVLALKDCQLRVESNTGAPSKNNPYEIVEPKWIVPIQMLSGADVLNVSLGLHSEANEGFDPKMDIAMPPKFDSGKQSSDFAFVIDDRIVNRLSRDVKKYTNTVSWKAQAKVPSSGSELKWDISSLQNDKDMVLVMDSSEIDMRQQNSVKLPEGVHVINITLKDRIPKRTSLLQNYPNPFNPETWIPYELSESGNVVVSIYDVSGRLVRKLDLGHKEAGMYVSKEKAVYWDGRNEVGEKASSGVYFYQIQSGKFSKVMKLVVIK